MKILVNQVQCSHCSDIIVSKYTHDYKHCGCGKTMVDGGRDYVRCSADAIQLTIYDDNTHETRREHLVWGSRGKKGDQPLKYTKIKDLTDDHIDAIIKTMPVRGLVLETIAKEQEMRGTNENI